MYGPSAQDSQAISTVSVLGVRIRVALSAGIIRRLGIFFLQLVARAFDHGQPRILVEARVLGGQGAAPEHAPGGLDAPRAPAAQAQADRRRAELGSRVGHTSGALADRPASPQATWVPLPSARVQGPVFGHAKI